MIRPAPSGQGQPEMFEIRDKGFTFAVDRRAARPRAALDWLLTPWPAVLHAQETGHFEQWQQRYEQAQEVQQRWEYYGERIDRATKPASADDIANLEEGNHEDTKARRRGCDPPACGWPSHDHARPA